MMLCFDLLTRPKFHSKVMHRKEMTHSEDSGSDTFQWPVIERDRVDGLRLIIWDKMKVPLCHYSVMHRKRVTSELRDSNFHLMTIKHSISKIEWASNDYITQLSSTSQLS